MSKRALITGITGYVGRGVARRLLEDGFEIIGLVRNSEDDFEKRVAELRADLGESEKLTFVRGDMMDDSALKDLNVEGITHIVHSAAVTRFNVEADLAQAANVDGSRNILEFAKGCPQLGCFSYISTIYACGLVDGEVLETRHQGRVLLQIIMKTASSMLRLYCKKNTENCPGRSCGSQPSLLMTITVG